MPAETPCAAIRLSGTRLRMEQRLRGISSLCRIYAVQLEGGGGSQSHEAYLNAGLHNGHLQAALVFSA